MASALEPWGQTTVNRCVTQARSGRPRPLVSIIDLHVGRDLSSMSSKMASALKAMAGALEKSGKKDSSALGSSAPAHACFRHTCCAQPFTRGLHNCGGAQAQAHGVRRREAQYNHARAFGSGAPFHTCGRHACWARPFMLVPHHGEVG